MMTIEIGWWAIPATITLFWVIYCIMPSRAPTGFSSLGDSTVGALFILIGLIIVLASWLAWAVAS